MIARMHSPARWSVMGAALACAGVAFTAPTARAEISGVAHNCTAGDPAQGCGTSFIGSLGDNVMTVEPATGGMVRFSESSPNAQVHAEEDGSGLCQVELPARTSALCPLASNGGHSYMHGSNGNDTLTIKPGATALLRVYGYPGDDTIHADDGNVQTVINCDLPAVNSGTADVAYIDTNDPEPLHCETVVRGSTGGDGDGGGGGDGGDGGGGGGGDGGGGGGGGGTTPPADTTGPVIPGPTSASAATERRGSFALTVGPFSENVTGTVALVSKAIRSGGKKAKIKLAPKPFTAAAGTKIRVAFKLTKKQRKLLAKSRRVKMTATVIARDALGNPSTRTITFQLKAARKRT